MIVDFATFCYRGDAHRLHQPGQLEKQVLSNGYNFDNVFVIYQGFSVGNRPDVPFYDEWIDGACIRLVWVDSDVIDSVLTKNGIDVDKPQYQSPTDKHHAWRYHVVNHLSAIQYSKADYIVFADSDCWMIKQPDSWVQRGIEILESNPQVFIVSPNDGEPERMTQVISQQMFMTRVDDFRNADFNQPGYSGNPRDYPEMPEYHAMLEGRIHYYCKATNRYRYVLPPEYRYWHFNRTTQDGLLETDTSKY